MRAFLLLFAACGGAGPQSVRVTSQQGIAIVTVSQIAGVHGPTALRLVGDDRRLPVWLHASRSLEWTVVAGRCSAGACEVEYDEDDDVFECSCTGAEYRPDGTPIDGGTPLVTYPVDYRNETVIIELRPSR